MSDARKKLRDDLLDEAADISARIKRRFLRQDLPAVIEMRQRQAMFIAAANSVMGFEVE